MTAGARSQGWLPRTPTPQEWPALCDWLDDGLRRGERGRLRAEYPLSMNVGPGAHRVITLGEVPAAHAMFHTVQVASRGSALPVALIGNVYTDPAQRGRGLASACVEACARAAAAGGSPLALLWSDAHDFYRRLGFEPAGCEQYTDLDTAGLARARAGGAPELEVGAPAEGDWPALEALYAAKPQHVRRRPGQLARLAAAPACRLAVARRADRPLAYAAAGRGDDLQGAVHEWAGSSDGVLACLEHLHREAGARLLLSGPVLEDPVDRLRRAGAAVRNGCLALARILDASALWSTIAPPECDVSLHGAGSGVRLRAAGESHEIGHVEALDLLFGPDSKADAEPAHTLPARARRAAQLPWPLYLWGFDSI